MIPLKWGPAAVCQTATESSMGNSVPETVELERSSDDRSLAGAVPVARKPFPVAAAVTRRHEDRERLAQKLPFGVAEDGLSASVPRADDAVLVGEHDRVGRRLEHRSETAL